MGWVATSVIDFFPFLTFPFIWIFSMTYRGGDIIILASHAPSQTSCGVGACLLDKSELLSRMEYDLNYIFKNALDSRSSFSIQGHCWPFSTFEHTRWPLTQKSFIDSINSPILSRVKKCISRSRKIIHLTWVSMSLLRSCTRPYFRYLSGVKPMESRKMGRRKKIWVPRERIVEVWRGTYCDLKW